MDKSVAQTILEIQKPLSQGEQNFVALHGVLQPNKNLVPGITDQDHIFNGTPRKMDPKTASYENVKDKDGSDESTKVYDKTLKVEEEVESLNEKMFELNTLYHIGSGSDRGYFIPKELQKNGRHKGVQFDQGAAGRNAKKPTTGSYSYDGKWTKTPEDEIPPHILAHMKEEVESVEEAKGEDEYNARYGAGGKKRPPADEMHPNQKKLDVAEPKGKLTAADFAKLRQEEVEAVEEAKGEDEYYKRYGAKGKKRPETEEGGAGRHKVNYVHPDKKNIGNDRFETKEKAVSYANSLKKKGYHEVSVTEEVESVEEAKGEDEYNARYGAGGKKRPPLDPVGKEDDDVNNDNKVDKADSYLSNRRKVVAKYLDKTPVVKEEKSSLRLSKTMKLGPHDAKVYRNTETGEHQVKFYTDGKHHSKADYYTDDKQDAHGTATVGLKDLAKEHTKKMFKEEEQIDEISRELATNYVRAARTSTRDAYYGDDSKTMGKRKKGIDLALLKKWGDKKFGLPEPKVKATTEDIDQIDELKKSTYQAAADEAKRRKENADAELDSGSKSKTLKKFSASYGKTLELAKKKMQKMDEKTLTPAEMKKREEIAMAIAKKNPNMPMANKMAIATAAAKKVAENVENLEEKEFSRDSLKAAMDALDKTKKAVTGERDMARKAVHMQRQNFLNKHIDYIKKRMSAEPAMAKEDIDDISEEEININFHRAEAKRVSQKINSLKSSEKPIPDGLFAELQKHKQEIAKAEKNARFQNEEVDFPTPAADSREQKTRVQRNKEGVLKVIKYKLPRKEIKIGEAMAEEKLNKLYETLSDENKEKFIVKLETESGVQQLIQFAEKQGF